MNLLILPLLICLVRRLPTRTKLVKKTKITKEDFVAVGDKERVIAIASLQ